MYYNLWSTDNERTDANDEVVIKSVYDPSPVGYSLPASNAFTGFTTTGGNVDNRPNPLTPEQKALCNIKGDFDKGYYFYRQQNKKGDTRFFYASGYRYFGSGALDYIYSAGCYWVAVPYDTNFGRHLDFSSGYVYPLNYAYRSYGFAVRSAEEKVLKCGLKKLQMMFRLREVYYA